MGLFDGLFKEKSCTVDNEKELTEINSLKELIASQNLEIEKLKLELHNLKNTTLSPKQIYILEKNLKSSRETNAILEQEILKLKQTNSYDTISHNEIYNNLINNNFIYKLRIDNFFKTVKFEEVRNFFNKNNILFVQDIKSLPSLKELLKIKNGDLALEKYENLKKGIVPWDIRVFLCKGDKVHKVYKNKRKFINYLNKHSIEFMDDMNNFNFESLIVKGGFPKKAIEEFKILTNNYFNEFKL